MNIQHIPSDTPHSTPCLECGGSPEEGAEEVAFYVFCSNPKCPMHCRAMIPECWPSTKEQWDAQARKSTNP